MLFTATPSSAVPAGHVCNSTYPERFHMLLLVRCGRLVSFTNIPAKSVVEAHIPLQPPEDHRLVLVLQLLQDYRHPLQSVLLGLFLRTFFKASGLQTAGNVFGSLLSGTATPASAVPAGHNSNGLHAASNPLRLLSVLLTSIPSRCVPSSHTCF